MTQIGYEKEARGVLERTRAEGVVLFIAGPEARSTIESGMLVVGSPSFQLRVPDVLRKTAWKIEALQRPQPSPYDEEAIFVMHRTGAGSVTLLVSGGRHGDGFTALGCLGYLQIPGTFPRVFRDIADKMISYQQSQRFQASFKYHTGRTKT